MQGKKIKILYLIDKLTLAGTQKHVFSLASGLDRDRFKPLVCSLKGDGPLREAYENKDIRVYILNLHKIYGLKAVKALLRLIKIMREEKIGIVHTYQFNPTVLGVIAAKLAGVKVILTARRDTGYWAKKWHHFAYRLVNKWTTKVIANSYCVKETSVNNEKINPRKVEVIYNGVDTSLFNKEFDKESIKKKYGILPHQKVVGMVAVIRREKRYQDFIKACSIVAQEMDNVKFLVVGSGYPDLTEQLKLMCEQEGINDKVIFTGRIENVAEVLSIFDAACLTSETEGFSNVILEYMAKGIPVIATAVGGNKEAIEDEINGMLIEVGDYKRLAEKINHLLADTEFAARLAAKAKDTIKNKFTIEKMIYTVSCIYETLKVRLTKGIIYKIKLRLKTHGLLFVIEKIAKRIVKPIFQIDRLMFFEKDIDKDKDFYFNGKRSQRLKTYVTRLKKNYQLIIFSKDNVNGHISELACLMRRDRKFIEDWFNRGKYCFSFVKKGKLVSYFWLTTDARCHDFMSRNYKAPNEAFVHTALTLSQFRGKGLATVLLNEIFVFLKNRNICKVHGFIVNDNHKSITSFIEPLGCRVSRKRAVYLRLFNKEKYYVYEK